MVDALVEDREEDGLGSLFEDRNRYISTTAGTGRVINRELEMCVVYSLAVVEPFAVFQTFKLPWLLLSMHVIRML